MPARQAGVVQWQNGSFPSFIRGFDSLHPLHDFTSPPCPNLPDPRGRIADGAMSEIKALLLTDVVDSTRLSETLGDSAMAEIWAAHDRVSRALLGPWRGREIDKTDGMLLLFDNAADAVAYAMEYHRALATLPTPLTARVGLHVGPVILRENAADDIARGAKPLEVEGLAKPIAARVMALARGGQTLLSAAAREDLGKTEHRLVSHGHWQIKGVSDPIELFEVGEPDARFVQPSDGEKAHRVVWMGDWWLPVNEIPNNLPYQATSFIGRERELAEVKRLLGGSRLLTLLGMGGLGKTRLSLQVAAEQIHDFPDGVWFLDLAPISDPALIVSETAQVLGVREEPGRPLLQTVCSHLKNAPRPADPRQLRARDQGVGADGQRHPQGGAARAHPGVEPRGAARAGRAVLSGAAAAGAGPRRRPRGPVAIDGGAPVRRPGAAAQARLRPQRARSAGGGRAGRAAGRHPAGARARRGADPLALRRRHQRPPQGPLQAADRRLARAAGAAADAARPRRLVVRAARRPKSRSCSTGSACSSTASTSPRPRRSAAASRWPARTCSTCSDR